MKTYTVAVLGATGAVGQEMIHILEERNFPVGKLVPLASARSAGKTLKFKGEDVTIGLACASCGSQGNQLAYGEVALFQEVNHFLANGTGGAQNCYGIHFHFSYLQIGWITQGVSLWDRWMCCHCEE